MAVQLMSAIHDIDRVRRAMALLDARNVEPTPQLAVIWDEELESASFASTYSQIGAQVRHGRPVRVISVGPKIFEVFDSLDRLAADQRVYGVSPVAKRPVGRTRPNTRSK